jgi:hypothetical protein
MLTILDLYWAHTLSGTLLWQGLLGRPASESGKSCHEPGATSGVIAAGGG